MEGTQVTDIEKKVDYPKFKLGKRITNLVTTDLKESWYDDRLPAELKDEIKEVIEELKTHDDYPCDEWKDKLWWQLDTVNNSNTEEERRNVLEQIKGYYEQYSKDKKAFDNAMEALKRNKIHLWPHSIPRYENGNWIFTGMKGISHGQESTSVHVTKDGQVIEESAKSYNYIGTDTGKVGNHTNTHEEKVYTLYDCFGPIGEYKTKEEAIKEMKNWYIDPELYPDGNADLRIEEDDVEVWNEVIHLPSDFD